MKPGNAFALRSASQRVCHHRSSESPPFIAVPSPEPQQLPQYYRWQGLTDMVLVIGASLGFQRVYLGWSPVGYARGQVLLWKESCPLSARAPPPGQPQQLLSARMQNTPMNYLCASEACLTGNVGTLQKGCKQWGLAANYASLSVSDAVTSAGGAGVFSCLPCEEEEGAKQTNHTLATV